MQECTRRHKAIQGDVRETQECTGRHKVIRRDATEMQEGTGKREKQGDTAEDIGGNREKRGDPKRVGRRQSEAQGYARGQSCRNKKTMGDDGRPGETQKNTR
jgi:hypothetical protein